jgi:glycosyltransferase involved in cell wall biosynthesis
MKLLIINSAKEWGGTEKWVRNTALGLAARGHTVYFGCRGTLFDARFSGSAVRLVKFPFANNIDLVTVARLRSFMRKNRVDVVLPSKQREYLLAGTAARLWTKTRVAGMFGIDRPITNMRNRIAFCKLFDMVLVVAEKIIGVLGQTKCFDVKKCRVVYTGVDPIERSDAARAACRRELGLVESDIVITGIGRLAPQKGFDYALRAFAIILKTCPQAKLVIAGPGDNAPYRALAAELGVADKVVFTGFREDITGLLLASDFYWLTSRSEGIPNTILEAMAAGVPVVAFDIAGVAEAMRNDVNGVLVPFEDIRMLAEKTVVLINDPEYLKRIVAAGRECMARDYSMEKMCADTERHLVELLGGIQPSVF